MKWLRQMLLSILALAGLAPAAEAAPNEKSAAIIPPGWDTFAAATRDLPGKILAKLPAELRDDATIQQEASRLALAAIVTEAMSALAGDGDHPMFLPAINLVLNAGQPNADTIYKSARITAGGAYRLRGTRGTVKQMTLGQGGAGPSDPQAGKLPAAARPFHDFDELKLDAEGRFDVMLSAERPSNYVGDWWQLDAGTATLILRAVSSDWARERDPTVAVERLDAVPGLPRRSASDLEGTIRRLPLGAELLATMLADNVLKLEAEGYLERFKDRGPRPGGVPGQFYYESVFDLGDDEALLIEVKAPTVCKYRSLMLTNEIEQAIDWYNNHSSLNDAQAPVDRDGMLRIIVAPKDPGVPNWLDTAGHSRGLIQGRWTGCDSTPVPTIRKLALRDVRAALPAETARVSHAQREAIVRERRAAFLQRPLW